MVIGQNEIPHTSWRISFALPSSCPFLFYVTSLSFSNTMYVNTYVIVKVYSLHLLERIISKIRPKIYRSLRLKRRKARSEHGSSMSLDALSSTVPISSTKLADGERCRLLANIVGKPRMGNTRPAGTTMENSWTSWGASRHGMRVITREKLIRLIYRYSSEFFFFFSFDKSISRYITFRSRRCPLHIHLYPVNPRATRRGRLARQIGLGGKMER